MFSCMTSFSQLTLIAKTKYLRTVIGFPSIKNQKNERTVSNDIVRSVSDDMFSLSAFFKFQI